jgi:hypothetical protein
VTLHAFNKLPQCIKNQFGTTELAQAFDMIQDTSFIQGYLSKVEADACRLGHDWSTDCAPAPTRFVRKSNQQSEVSLFVLGARSNINKCTLAGQPTKEALGNGGNDLLSFEAARSYRKNNEKYYAVHRRYIAKEIAFCAAAKGSMKKTEDWDTAIVNSFFNLDD